MITKFKIFENESSEIKIGDYVLLKVELDDIFHKSNFNSLEQTRKFNDFVNNNIGKVVSLANNYLILKYYDISFFIKHLFTNSGLLTINKKTVYLHDSDLDKLKLKIESEKYNL
jgi:hypothetical protein